MSSGKTKTWYKEHEIRDIVGSDTLKNGAIPISEIFSAYQGEGHFTGQPVVFLRTGGCDYACSWCDSLYAVDARTHGKNWSWQDAQGIAKVIRAIDPHNYIRWLTLTGGNPAMHKGQSRFELFEELKTLTGKYFAIETQGTLFPSWHVLLDHVTLSPKPPSSGNTTAIDHPALEDWVYASERFNDEVGQYYWEDDLCLKIVIADKEDLAYAASVHKKWPEIPLYLQPMTPQTLKRGLTDRLISDTIQLQQWVLDSGDFNLGVTKVMPQIHAILHGIGRGF